MHFPVRMGHPNRPIPEWGRTEQAPGPGHQIRSPGRGSGTGPNRGPTASLNLIRSSFHDTVAV
jgi:hypothetical protein